MSNVSLSDLLTSLKNVVTALNGASQTFLNVNGLQNSTNVSSTTLVKSGTGRLAMVSIVVSGSGNGTIYDSSSAASLSNPIFVIPNTPGVIFANLPISNGIVVVPGSGQTVTVSFS